MYWSTSKVLMVLLLVGFIATALDVPIAKAEGPVYIKADGSVNPADAPISRLGDDMYVLVDGINESLIVERDNIVVDGAGYTVQGSGVNYSRGLDLTQRLNVTIKRMKIQGFHYGINLEYSSGNHIGENDLANNHYGIRISYSSNNILRNNTMAGNSYSFFVDGSSLPHFVNDVDSSNTVDGKPVCYLVDETDRVVPADAGTVVLVNCARVTVQDLDLSGNQQGVLLAYTTSSVVTRNSITSNLYGVRLYNSSYNEISNNNLLTSDYYGIFLLSSSDGNILAGNVITASIYYGILLSASSCNKIIGNGVAGNWGGIWVSSSSGNLVSGNNLTANSDHGVRFSYSSDNRVIGNSVSGNMHGVWIHYSSTNNYVAGNNIIANYYGISAEDSANSLVARNNVLDNIYGVFFLAASGGSIYHNNFVGNTHNVHSEESVNLWDDGYPSGGNRWDNYIGVDSNHDEIGDTPYIIDSNNRDRYPLMNPHADLHDVGISAVTSPKNVVGQGYKCNVSVTVTNQGDFTETLNITAYSNSTLFGQAQAMLAAGDSFIANLVWNTAGFEKGNCSISAYVAPVLNETATADNAFSDGMIFVGIAGDVNADDKVDAQDVYKVAQAYNSEPGFPNWNAVCDINNDGMVDVIDYYRVCKNYGLPHP